MDEVHVPSDSQARLLRIARWTLEDVVQGGQRQVEQIGDPCLQSTPSTPLYQTVVDMTQAAASRDSRVTPIRREELNHIRIDISILSRLEMVDDPLLLELGKHGLHIAQGERRGVLLPQVAAQYRWDIRTFLEQTCLKAGLPKNAWKEPNTLVSSFSALIIEESL